MIGIHLPPCTRSFSYFNLQNYFWHRKQNSSKSCQTNQLKKEYIGIKNNLKSDAEVFMIFVVPEEDSATKKEFDKLDDLDTKHKSIITWNDIVNIIKSMMADEFKCKISPLT